MCFPHYFMLTFINHLNSAQLVCAGSALFDVKEWDLANPSGKGYTPKVNPDEPRLQALGMALEQLNSVVTQRDVP
jgi:hypothetical protein